MKTKFENPQFFAGEFGFEDGRLNRLSMTFTPNGLVEYYVSSKTLACKLLIEKDLSESARSQIVNCFPK